MSKDRADDVSKRHLGSEFPEVNQDLTLNARRYLFVTRDHNGHFFSGLGIAKPKSAMTPLANRRDNIELYVIFFAERFQIAQKLSSILGFHRKDSLTYGPTANVNPPSYSQHCSNGGAASLQEIPHKYVFSEQSFVFGEQHTNVLTLFDKGSIGLSRFIKQPLSPISWETIHESISL